MWSLFKAFILLVAAVVLLDEDGCSSTLLEAFLLVVRPELGLNEDGRLGHLLIQSVLRRYTPGLINTPQDSLILTATCTVTNLLIRSDAYK